MSPTQLNSTVQVSQKAGLDNGSCHTCIPKELNIKASIEIYMKTDIYEKEGNLSLP